MFVRQKVVKNKPHFYLVENQRKDGKVRQKTLAYLGDSNTLDGAISTLLSEIVQFEEAAARWMEKAEERKLEMPEHIRESIPKYGRKYLCHHDIVMYWECLRRAQYCERAIKRLERRLEKLQQLVVPNI